VVLAERLVGGSYGIQRVALGAGRRGQPLGSADLHDLLAALLQEHRQPGAEAAGSFHRPTPTARNLHAGEVEQLLVADGIGAHGGLGQHTAAVADGGGGQGVAMESTPTGAVDQLCQHGHAVVLLG
jgi:hypothetical protein